MTAPENCRIVDFDESYREAVVALWHDCGLYRPWNNPDKDIDRKKTDAQGRFWLLMEDNGPVERLVATIMIGYDGHRGTIFYLGVAPDRQGAGYGKFLMEEAERFLLDRKCPKISLMVRRTNTPVVAFYEGLGFAEDEAMVLGKRLIPDI